MKLSTEMGKLRDLIGEVKSVELLAKAGFDALDYTFFPHVENGTSLWLRDDYMSRAHELRLAAEYNGICFNQAHGPIDFHREYLFDWNIELLPLNIRCLEVCSQLGIPHMVIHPIRSAPGCGNSELLELNREYYTRLLPYARNLGVKLCLENMYGHGEGTDRKDMLSAPEEYAGFYDSLSSGFVTCCVDTGHAVLAGEDPAHMIRTLGYRLGALHVNDNGGKTDDHWIPFQGVIDWPEVMKALAEVNYDGFLTMEALRIYRNFEESFYLTSAKYLCDVGRYLSDLFERCRTLLCVQL